MHVNLGNGQTEYGPGIDIILTGDEVVMAIMAYLVAHDVHINGPLTVTVNSELCSYGKVYVDPSGSVIFRGRRISGRGEHERPDVADAV